MFIESFHWEFYQVKQIIIMWDILCDKSKDIIGIFIKFQKFKLPKDN